MAAIMNKLLVLLFLFFSSSSFATLKQVQWTAYGSMEMLDCPSLNTTMNSGSCPASAVPPNSLTRMADTGYYSGSLCFGPIKTCYWAPNPCTGTDVATVREAGDVECGPPVPPEGSSSSSSSEPACPSGQTRDANHSCSSCTNGQVLNISTGSCESQNSCSFPEKYSSYDNACHPNPDNCAINASYNVLTGESCASSPVLPSPTCPAGWQLLPNNTCAATNSNSGSSSGAASSVNNSSPSSTGSSAASSVKPPTSNTDNTDQNQSTSGSASIPPGTPKSVCTQSNSESACSVMENCELTFGVGRCAGVTGNITCPNSYIVNGQKVCVLPSQTSGSGSASSSANGNSGGSGSAGSASSQAGECDPTAKSYDECMGRNKTPTTAQTKAITDKFKTDTDKALSDYEKLLKDDITAATSSGVPFKEASDNAKTSLLSFFPQAQECVPLTMTFKIVGTVTLNCEFFNMWKRLFGWFLSVSTAIYIYHISIRPVEK